MYTLIERNQDLPVKSACECLNVSCSGYYDWRKRPLSTPFEMEVKDEIHRIVLGFPGYGYRRVTQQLQRDGYKVNSKRVLNLMREDNLLCVRNKSFKPVTTNSNHNLQVYPNLARDMEVTGMNQLWAADITYVRLAREFIYLAVIIDVFSRKCIGWELDRNMDTQLTLNALHQALKERWSSNLNLVHHSDQGVQYASHDYVNCLKNHGIRISMSRKGNPYDNPYAESFIKTLKYEEVYLTDYEMFREAYESVDGFIEEVYNQKRLHSSIGYLTPNEFEMGSKYINH